MRRLVVCAAVAAAVAPGIAGATNGMNMEGYGPVATAMGGASMAYDNGTAALMNNPATLGLMPEGMRLDLAVGRLGPNVKSSVPGMPDASSSADAFYMPAAGFALKRGRYTTGIGVFAQGGMGTEYSGDSFMSAGSGLTTRSEVSVGRVLVPLVYDVDPNFKIGGSLDFVWAGMDLQMAMSGAQMFGMMPGSPQTYGALGGSLVSGLGAAIAGGQITSVNWGYFDFSNSNKFTGEATATGVGGKIGMVYKASPQLTVGAAYHFKTQLSDLQTSNATVSLNVTGPMVGGGTATVPLTGKITVKDFQWPDMIALGLAYQASDALMVVADYKRIKWSGVMQDFKMTFTASTAASNGSFGGASLDAVLYQKWEDQDVVMIGGAYRMNEKTTLRAGVNLATNPIPDMYMNPLFPATVKNHYMAGFGYAFDRASSVDFSLTLAPEVSATNGQGVTTTHSQTNMQLMYSRRF